MTLFGKEHVDRYRETGGGDGHDWKGTVTLLLTTTGRRSGEERTTPLIYQPDGDRYVIVASQGGADEHPAWYLNLSADQNVEVQVKDERFDATASTAEGEERERLWKLMTATWPAYDQYQAKTDRQIPVVVLTPV
ncbi:MAG: nitroreductase family deazaflavin-dependent oxidoreductase [Thermoleophilaceae bacterium]